MTQARSIYRSPEDQSRIDSLYDELLARWPVPCDELTVGTRFGKVNVLRSGPAGGAPVMLLHAASMASTSWLPNVGHLTSAGFQTFAVDYIGEAGRSELADIDRFPKSGSDIGQVYAEIADGLGIAGTGVVGASAGGHAAMRFALAAPRTVTRLALLGPMGVVPLGVGAVVRMMMVSMFPSDARVARTSRWALGESDAVQETFGPWFERVLRSIASPPRVGRPAALKPAEKAMIDRPVLLVLGTRDNLVGRPERASRAAQSFPNLRVEVLDSAHLIGVERADAVNRLLVDFLGQGG